ncbi:MAG: hypothetical protein FWC40_05500, partial [Proteobacteria bacterium]|nr:hypothetical protein [Pseudomonadota bacterium]
MSVIVDAVTQRGWHIVSGAHRRPLTWRPFAFVVGEAAFPLPDGFEAWAVEAGAWLTYEGDQERVCGGPLSITTGTLSQGG